MPKQSDAQHETSLPTPESWNDLLPDVPTGQDDYFSNTRTLKASFGNQQICHYMIISPLNLQVIPYSGAERTLEKQVNPILISLLPTKHTVMIICNFPIPPQDHILGVYSVVQHQPCKEFMLGHKSSKMACD